jgi:hypothetical protein
LEDHLTEEVFRAPSSLWSAAFAKDKGLRPFFCSLNALLNRDEIYNKDDFSVCGFYDFSDVLDFSGTQFSRLTSYARVTRELRINLYGKLRLTRLSRYPQKLR